MGRGWGVFVRTPDSDRDDHPRKVQGHTLDRPLLSADGDPDLGNETPSLIFYVMLEVSQNPCILGYVLCIQETFMMHAPGLFDLPDHLARLSATDDPLEALERHVDFEAFRTVLMEAPGYGVRAKGRRPPYDPVTMFKVLVLASMHNPGDERMEFLIRDRLSWLRFPGFEIGEPTPDQKTIWLFREKLTRSGAFQSLFAAFENQLCDAATNPREVRSWMPLWCQRRANG